MTKVRIASTPILEEEVPASDIGIMWILGGSFVGMDESQRVSTSGHKLAGFPVWGANGAGSISRYLSGNRQVEP